MPARLLPIIPLLTLLACASTPPPPAVPTTVTVAAPADRLRARLETAMHELLLDAAPTSFGLRGTARGSADQAWSDCPRIVVTDEDSPLVRSDWASPGGRDAEVTANLRPRDGQTEVLVTVSFAATYQDRYRGTPFTNPCPSTGLLERRLLAAVQGG